MAACLLAILTIQSALAQTTISTGSIQGVVTDPSGAVLRGAKVTILNKANGQSVSAVTNDAGAYVSGALAPGLYEVRVESTGFKTTVQPVNVQLNTTSTANAKLSLGDSNQVVEVQAESVSVNTEQATVQGILTAQQIQNMKANEHANNFRVLGPDETASNRLDKIYDLTGKIWMEPLLDVDENLTRDGRVVEMLSEHMGDVVGRLFREFAVTLAVTILVSAVVSLTLTPMMCAKLLRNRKGERRSRFYEASERFYDRIIEKYGTTLRWVLRHQTATLVVTVATLILTIALFIIIPKGFFPVQDTGVILGISDAPQTVSFEAMAERQQKLAQVILKDPAVDSLSSFIGIDGVNTTPNSGRIQINLKPKSQRDGSASDVIRRLQPELAQVPGITLYMQPVQDLTVEDRISRTQFQYSLESPDLNDLNAWVPRLMDKLRSLPELRDVASDQLTNGLEANLVIDRDTAARLGILPQAIDDTLYDAFGQRQVSTIYTQLNQYHVVLEALPEFQQSPDSLKSIYVHSSTGTQVPLSAFTHFEHANSLLAVNHQGQFPVVTLSFNLAPGVSLGEATKAIDQAEREINLPASIHTSFQGTAAAFQKSLSSEPYLILAALITVYIVLGVLYESYIHPITILSTLPSAGVGAILALILTRNDFNVIALIGIILLIGIVKKNAIMSASSLVCE